MSSATHRLSFRRLVMAIVVAIAVASGGFFAYQAWASNQADPAPDPWFAAYVDVTATPSYEFESATKESGKEVMLSFIVAAKDGACTPTWGTAYTMDEAAVSLDLDRRIARLQQRAPQRRARDRMHRPQRSRRRLQFGAQPLRLHDD